MSLDPFFTPNSIAIIGASTKPHKLGYAVLDNLVNGGYLIEDRFSFRVNGIDMAVFDEVAAID